MGERVIIIAAAAAVSAAVIWIYLQEPRMP
jgi:hypothetical protein